MEKRIVHTGTPKHSGRYPWGSGGNPNQRSTSFRQEVKSLKKQGIGEVAIAKGMGIKTSQLRARISISKDEQTKINAAEALKLKAKGMSNVAIGKQMGRGESYIRTLLDPTLKQRADITRTTAEILKEAVNKDKYIDVGLGVENHLGISRTKLKTAIALTEEEGYRIHKFDTPQLGTNKKTNLMVLTKEDVSYGEVRKNKDQIKLINKYSEDGGKSFLGIEPIKNIDSKRIKIQYHEDGGSDKDGVIELRRGVEDLSLGSKKYAQVRIGVDGTHFLKGMAMYSDDMPKGIDVLYNTNKHVGTPKERVFKEAKADVDNPFGATVRQKHYIDANGKKQLSALNSVNEEGDWDTWSKNLSSQMLSKQSPALAKKQLGLTYDGKKEEFDEIMALTNPTIKKKLLGSFADSCDSAAVHLKAAALPRQASRVIIPIPDMKETEVYAPKFRNGEVVVLIRHPHGGIFEIPELVVNNNQKTAKRRLGGSNPAEDAIGIHPKVAARLSGADFDGDTVLVIPNPVVSRGNRAIKTASPLKGLINFDPKESYAPYDGMTTIDGGIYRAKTGSVDYGGKRPVTRTKQVKMGDISNLITDMTIKGVDIKGDEIARAVKHSMVVIDSEKHSLNYKQSYIENGIASLKAKYQGGPTKGAATLISRAKSPTRIMYREEGKKVLNPETGKTKRVYADPETGKKLYEYKDEAYTVYKDSKTGKAYPLKGVTVEKRNALVKEGVIKEEIKKKTTTVRKMALVEDAFTLSSGTQIESVYATHANKLKALANTARKESLTVPNVVWSPSAKEAYAPEIISLKAKLNIAQMNKPLERQAQLLGGSVLARKKLDNPGMQPDEIKKIKGQQLINARTRMGAKKQKIEITDKEWEAIQSGAVSNSELTKILNNTDLNKIKQLATPKTSTTLTPAKLSQAKAYLNAGYTQAEVADKLGVSVSSLPKGSA